MKQPLPIDSYQPVISYYSKMDLFYKKVWADHIHFGLFSGLSKYSQYNIDEAGQEYTKQLLSHGLSALPLYRRKENELIIIELCCGDAPIHLHLVEMGIKGIYHGVDIRNESIKKSRRIWSDNSFKEDIKLVPNFHHTTAEMFLNNFTDKADLIVCQDSFYHFREKAYVFKLISQVLRPGAIFLFSDFAIHQSLLNDSLFKQYFIDRQAESFPLSYDYKKEFSLRYRSAKLNKCEYESEKILKESGLFILERINHSEDLNATYNKALNNIKKLQDSAGSVIPEMKLSEYERAFTYLVRLEEKNKFQLLWWIAARKNDQYDINCDSKEPFILELNIDHNGYSFRRTNFKRELSRFPLFDGMSFKVKKAEYLGLVGKNGIGKTTLLKAIMGFLPHDTSLNVVRRPSKISIVNQDPILFEDFAVGRAIQIVFEANENKSKIFKSFLNIIKECNLVEIVGYQMKNLSRGQRQRAAVALAFASNPDLLLLDEPLASQDYIQKEEMLILLKKIKKLNPELSVIHVTHDWKEIEDIADRFVEITGGQLVEFKPRLSMKKTQNI